MVDRGVQIEPIYNGQRALCAYRLIIWDVETDDGKDSGRRQIIEIMELEKSNLRLYTIAVQFGRQFRHVTNEMFDQIFWYNENAESIFGKATTIETKIYKLLETFPEVYTNDDKHSDTRLTRE